MAKTMPITFAESAFQDLEDILAYYAGQAMPQVGSRFVAEIITDIELLSSQPRMGRIVPEFEQDFLLELIRPPFRIVYRVDRDQVRIVRVWRSERLLKLSQDD
ncbi:MAG: type II toxin-antitoxin system RelE/ParE family toxin [Desulfurivibrionaceae bacterium]|jgi:plasmid stabilization system protein ParE